jgi:site-specific DNA-adenine methylase
MYNFLINEDIEIYNLDGKDIYNKYKTDKKALIFMDPPYMATNNSFYNNGDNIGNLNIYEHLYYNPIDKENAKIYLILENTWITNILQYAINYNCICLLKPILINFLLS